MTVAAKPETATARAAESIRRCDPWNSLRSALPADNAAPFAISAAVEVVGALVEAFGPLVERALAPSVGYVQVQVVNHPDEANAAIRDGWELIGVAIHQNAPAEYHLGLKAAT